MNTIIVEANELIASQIWKVEYFQTGSRLGIRSKHSRKLCELVSQRKEAFDPSKKTKVPKIYIGLEDIEPVVGLMRKSKEHSAHEVKSISKMFYKGDILFGRLRPILNKILYVESLTNEFGICSNEFIVLTPNLDLVDPIYLRAVLSSAQIQEAIKRFQSGSTLPRIYADDLLNIEIPLPTLTKQIEIGKRMQTLAKEYGDASIRLDQIKEDFLKIKLS
ncbi:MAG: hypothetical protein COV10_01905 [Candidatus Vogelbacteria bacterium CG10_big_fil_rev_8_21_14_0_10_51_16]|uniref:Type I restriction modification DNA specificity domain-containing protein n=1 Tax=Candidatus Vogelbacteria bacterium CG10_big_fil_rev_8_21_14_0_10_51_16 TaxID=1975045 RepID=A0A2H0RES5_9BACT|nr:MAG: hypothetical protein COV10_01905 [Candidatus Vogelbacteria bacterium CG10_big_fil_rev_8_21_14_0_10_51_16]